MSTKSLVAAGRATISLLLAGWATAHAGSLYLADGAAADLASSNFSSDGQFWHADDITSVGPFNGQMPQLTLDFGSGPVTGVRFRFDPALGRLSFLNSAGVATGDFIEPMHLSGGYDADYSNGFVTYGQLAPQLLNATSFPTGPFNIATALNAYRFLWPTQCPNSEITRDNCMSFDDFVGFQAVIIEIDPEDFELQFNYNNGFATLPSDTITGLFQLGANSETYTGPFVNVGPNFCFHDGNLVDCAAATVTVPEPETLPLLLAGVGLMIGLARRGRVISRKA
jgi:hypothetical protein